jgi:hypothetical protein
MKILHRFAFMNLLLAVFVASVALSAFADPPGRAVRLKYISGPVSIQPGGVNDWVEAVVNRPLTTADRVWTDKQARAELHLGSAALRMNAETSLTLTNVSDDIVQIELDQGTLNLHIRHLFGGETYEIDTPNQAFTILKSGDYRFDVDPNADTTSVTVWHGEGEANGQGPGVKLRSGEQASFTGGTSLQHQAGKAPGFDGFDDWCRVRDDREDHAKSYQYVSADVVGADDLDEYGSWRTTGEYGAVWVPAVAPGWAPYHYGHWVWVEPWGWTWVDDAPWGFAPCHYGRWVHYGGFWAWAPGPVVVVRPVYAPALVAWVGGPHFGVGLSFGGGGGVGWFALGWGEPYVPSYAVSRTYFQQVNVSNTHITNITNVTNNYYVTNNNTTVVNNNIQNIHYANQNVAGAVTAVPTRTMTNSEPVAKAAVTVPASEVRAGAFATAAPVAPQRNSVLGVKAGAPTAVPPAQAMARPVVSHAAPPPKPVPFEAKQEVLARNPGRPLDAQTEAQVRANAVRQTPPAANRTTPSPQPAKPNLPGVPTEPKPAAAEAGPSSPVAAPPASANSPGRIVPRPPQPGVQPGSMNPASAANATPNPSRPVPRPPQPQLERTSGGIAQPAAPVPHPVAGSPAAPAASAARPASNPANTNAAQPRPQARPVSQPSAPSSPAPPRPQTQARPQLESRSQAPRPPHEQSHSQPKQNHSEPKPEHKNENK